MIPQSPPIGSSAPSTEKLPGKVGIWIGILLIVVGVVGGIALLVSGLKTTFEGLGDFQRLPIQSGGTVQVDELEKVSVYAERPSLDSGSSFSSGTTSNIVGPSVGIIVTAPDGSSVPVSVRSGSETYTWDGRDGYLIATFGPETTGTYRIETVITGDLGGYRELAVGKGVTGDGVGAMVGGILGGAAAVLVGIVVLIASSVRRGRAKRRLQGPPVFGAGPGPGGGWAPPPVAVPGGYPPAAPGYAPGYPPAPPAAPGYPPAAPGYPPVPPGYPPSTGGYGPPSTYVPPSGTPWTPPGGDTAPGWVPPPAPPPPGYGPTDGPVS